MGARSLKSLAQSIPTLLKRTLQSRAVRRLAWSAVITALVASMDLLSWNIFFVKWIAEFRGRPGPDPRLTYVILDDEHFSIADVKDALAHYAPESTHLFSQPKRPTHFLYRWSEGGYPVVTSTQIRNHEVDPVLLKSKHVVLGDRPDAESLAESDQILQRRMREWDAHLNNRKMPVLSPPALAAALFALTLLCTWIVLEFSVAQSMGLVSLVATIVLATSTAFFGTLWIPVGTLLMGLLVAFYVTMPLRVLVESTRRWKLEERTVLQHRIEEMKTHFLSLVTHDLKTPVARIQGWAEWLKTSPRLSEPGATQELASLEHIVRSSEELNRFIASLLDLTRLESENLLIQLESRDINRVIEKTAQEFETLRARKDIRWTLSLEPLFPIHVDEKLMIKVLRNLIDNALKYSPIGSSVSIQTRDLGESVQILVQDEGPGLSAEEVESVFHRFYRANNEATRSVSGSGLGLYLSRFFIQAMGGTLTVKSTPGEGSTFIVTLPVQATHPLTPPFQETPHVEHSRRR